MFKPYPEAHNVFRPLIGLQDLKQRILRYKVQFCCLLAVCIVSFAVFCLPRDKLAMRTPTAAHSLTTNTDLEGNLAGSISSPDNNNELKADSDPYSDTPSIDLKVFEHSNNKPDPKKLEKAKKKRPNMVGADSLTSDYVPVFNHLIILPCHSIFAPELNGNKKTYPSKYGAIEDPDNWLMEPFQMESNDHMSFFKHVELAMNELHDTIHETILVISGGYTKPAIEKSEAASYYEVAEKSGLSKHPYFKFGTNIFLEEYARDSYENVLYSIATYYKQFNKFPQKITIVGFGFKKERFFTSHLTTLGYYMMPNIINNELDFKNLPDTPHAKYISAGPGMPNRPDHYTDEEYKTYRSNFWTNLYKSEKKNALDLFKANPFGSKNSVLNDKKLKRDPWKKHHLSFQFYESNNQTLNALLEMDNYEIREAWNIYQNRVMPRFPLFSAH